MAEFIYRLYNHQIFYFQTKMVKKAFKRLSRSVRPSNYDITIHPNLETFTFTI